VNPAPLRPRRGPVRFDLCKNLRDALRHPPAEPVKQLARGAALAPLLLKAGPHPATVEGHTDAKGSDAYNQTLSEKRARAVRDWLAARGALPITSPIQGWGERRPIAPNLKPDGSDDPAGRQKNRRVEVTLDLCKSFESLD
jgi:flagellar motor protein MotB